MWGPSIGNLPESVSPTEPTPQRSSGRNGGVVRSTLGAPLARDQPLF
jgi:hypothetical protein